jgi:hypothetical protein
MGNTGNSGEAHPRASASPFIAARRHGRNLLTIVAIFEPPKVDSSEVHITQRKCDWRDSTASVKEATGFRSGPWRTRFYLTPLQQVIDISQ